MRRSPGTDDVRPAARAHADSDMLVSCSSCGAAAAWSALVRRKVLEGAALQNHLAVPAEGWVVDVRECSRCGRSLARKVRT